jgi:hypothetical protein
MASPNPLNPLSPLNPLYRKHPACIPGGTLADALGRSLALPSRCGQLTGILYQKSIDELRWMLEYACRENATYFSSHFPETSAGRITWRNGQFRWDFI